MMRAAAISVIRQTVPGDAEFLAWAIMTASRSHLARGWFDIALNQPADRCLEFLAKLSTATVPSWWHFSRFLLAEVDGDPAAALCAFSAAEAYPLSEAAMTEVAEALERGRIKGFAEAQITYIIGNDAAERAYERSGFRFAGEQRHADVEAVTGAPGLRRVVRRL